MLSDLIVTLYLEFLEWGWIALAIAAAIIASCYTMRSHGRDIDRLLKRLDNVPDDLPLTEGERLVGTLEPTDSSAPTAILCVTSFSGFGLHLVAAVCRLFPRYFTNFIFISAAVSESRLTKKTKDLGGRGGAAERDLKRYVAWARTRGLRAGYRTTTGAELVPALHELCRGLVLEYPRCVVFIGKPIIREREYPRSSYERMATSLDRRLQFEKIQTILLPIGVADSTR